MTETPFLVLDNLKDFQKKVSKGGLVIVYFTASWCQPCKKISPLFEDSSAEYYDKALFIKCDVDKGAEIKKEYKVNYIPCIHVWYNGELVSEITKIHDRNYDTTLISIINKFGPKKNKEEMVGKLPEKTDKIIEKAVKATEKEEKRTSRKHKEVTTKEISKKESTTKVEKPIKKDAKVVQDEKEVIELNDMLTSRLSLDD